MTIESRQNSSRALPTLEDQRNYWDERWTSGRDQYPNPWARRRADTILAMLRSLELTRPDILDLGCGTGWFTAELAELGNATGVELSEAAIALAQSNYRNALFIAGNALEMELPAAHFDVVVSMEVIAHAENQDQYVARAVQALKPGGYFVVTTVNKFVNDRMEWPPEPDAYITRWLDRKALKRLLRRHGLRMLRITSVIPMGQRGILRLVNSDKLNRVVHHLLSPATVESLKERAGLGGTLIALAQRAE